MKGLPARLFIIRCQSLKNNGQFDQVSQRVKRETEPAGKVVDFSGIGLCRFYGKTDVNNMFVLRMLTGIIEADFVTEPIVRLIPAYRKPICNH